GGGAGDAEVPGLGFEGGHATVVDHRPSPGDVLPRWKPVVFATGMASLHVPSSPMGRATDEAILPSRPRRTGSGILVIFSSGCATISDDAYGVLVLVWRRTRGRDRSPQNAALTAWRVERPRVRIGPGAFRL